MKRGTTVPLLRLSKDPFDNDFTGEYKDEKMDYVLPMVITANIEHCADTCFVPSVLTPQIQANLPEVKGCTKNQWTLMVVEQPSSALPDQLVRSGFDHLFPVTQNPIAVMVCDQSIIGLIAKYHIYCIVHRNKQAIVGISLVPLRFEPR